MNNIEYVVENSDNVVINKKNIVPIINTIKGSCYKHWSYKDEVFSKLKEKKIIIFAFMLESMNFCFWPNYEWTITYNGEKYYGSDTLLYTLINATNEKNIKLNINDLHNLS